LTARHQPGSGAQHPPPLKPEQHRKHRHHHLTQAKWCPSCTGSHQGCVVGVPVDGRGCRCRAPPDPAGRSHRGCAEGRGVSARPAISSSCKLWQAASCAQQHRSRRWSMSFPTRSSGAGKSPRARTSTRRPSPAMAFADRCTSVRGDASSGEVAPVENLLRRTLQHQQPLGRPPSGGEV